VVCCSKLQCVATQRGEVCCSVLQRVAECCSVLECVAVCCSNLALIASAAADARHAAMSSELQSLSWSHFPHRLPQHTPTPPHSPTTLLDAFVTQSPNTESRDSESSAERVRGKKIPPLSLHSPPAAELGMRCKESNRKISWSSLSLSPRVQCVAVCGSVLQCVAMYREKSNREISWSSLLLSPRVCVAVCCSVFHCGAVWCSVVQCVAVCCSVLQYVAMCCSVL